jgi:hypothetical protein
LFLVFDIAAIRKALELIGVTPCVGQHRQQVLAREIDIR